MAADESTEHEPDPEPVTTPTLLYRGIKALIRQLQDESDLGVYEAIGALEAAKADLLAMLDG